MGLNTMVTLMQQGIWQVLKMTGPILIAALLVGLIVAVFQAVTSIQEQTLTFLPKLFTILVMLALLSGWMFTSMRTYVIEIFNMIPRV